MIALWNKVLLLNINNSWTKFAVFQGNSLRHQNRIETSQLRLKHLRDLKQRFPEMPVCFASVVPDKNSLVQKVFPKKNLHSISHQSPLGFEVIFPKPQSVGADRLANVAAVRAHYYVPSIVLDFGTALTFDVIDRSGNYLGGVIAPGLGVFTEYLSERTALLPQISIQPQKSFIGKSTKAAMRSGLNHGYRGLVKEITTGIKKEMQIKKLDLIATGGQAAIMAKAIPEINIIDPMLTMKGIAQIGQHWQNMTS